MMTVEEKPDVTYNDVGGCKEQIEKMREVCQTFFTCVETCTHQLILDMFYLHFAEYIF
jgi:ATP-dependent 26S proteasome regulatory subunit